MKVLCLIYKAVMLVVPIGSYRGFLVMNYLEWLSYFQDFSAIREVWKNIVEMLWSQNRVWVFGAVRWENSRQHRACHRGWTVPKRLNREHGVTRLLWPPWCRCSLLCAALACHMCPKVNKEVPGLFISISQGHWPRATVVSSEHVHLGSDHIFLGHMTLFKDLGDKV